jgi:hypothetical protein
LLTHQPKTGFTLPGEKAYFQSYFRAKAMNEIHSSTKMAQVCVMNEIHSLFLYSWRLEYTTPTLSSTEHSLMRSPISDKSKAFWWRAIALSSFSDLSYLA